MKIMATNLNQVQKHVPIRLFVFGMKSVDTQLTCLKSTDRQTDRQTDRLTDWLTSRLLNLALRMHTWGNYIIQPYMPRLSHSSGSKTATKVGSRKALYV